MIESDGGKFSDESGSEAMVYWTKDGVTKAIDASHYPNGPQGLIDKIILHNSLFPETAYETVGFGKDRGGSFRVIVKQKFVAGKPASTESINNFAKNSGFEKKQGWYYTKDGKRISDLNSKNVVETSDGNLAVLDCDVEFTSEHLQQPRPVNIDIHTQVKDQKAENQAIVSQLLDHLKSMDVEVHGRKDMEEYLKSHDPEGLQKMQEQREMEEIKQKAIADGIFMKAPNGKKSNLTEKQWLQTRTKNFKKWFGDWENDPQNASKVVDENGEPMIVYHGGENNISSFITYHLDSEVGDMYGAYFTKEKKYAKTYNKGTLYEVFLNIKKPLVTEGPWTGVINKDQVTDITSEYDGIVNDKFDNGIMYKLHLAKTRTEIIVFNPNQIKSATDNNGDFSTTNDDIQAAWGKKEGRRNFYDKDLLPSEVKSIQDYIETLPDATDTSKGLWHIVSHTNGKLKGKKFAYKFNTSLLQYANNRKDKHDGFEILDKRDVSNLNEEQLNILENGIRNRENIDSVLSKQGIRNEERSLYDSDVIVNNRQAEGNNDRLDRETLQGEPNGRRNNRDGRSNQRSSAIEKFQTPQGELYGFVDKDGKMYLDETVISPEHPIHEYTHLWDRTVQQKNPERATFNSMFPIVGCGRQIVAMRY